MGDCQGERKIGARCEWRDAFFGVDLTSVKWESRREEKRMLERKARKVDCRKTEKWRKKIVSAGDGTGLVRTRSTG